MAEPRVRGLLDGDGSYVENRPTKWQQTLGILNEYNPIDAFWRLYESDMAKGGPITEENIADGMTVAGTVMGGSSFVPKEANALNMGIRAYHGSPHDFDRFDMSKIGTGEGAQAYGHGLYFAEKEAVANDYRKVLSRKAMQDPAYAKKYEDKLPPALTADELAEQKALDAKRQNYGGAGSLFGGYLPPDEMKRFKELNRKWWDRKDAEDEFRAGHSYEVEIDAKPNDFVDWDLPVNAQPPAIRQAIYDLLPENKKYLADSDMPFGEWYRSVSRPSNQMSTGVRRGQFERILAAKGIPGIRYLDAGSRRAGDGTRNYVVFDDKLINILRKYGIAGLLGSSAAYNAMSDQPQEQY